MNESLLKIRHERNKKDFPYLTLENDEYIELALKRANICLIMIIISTTAALFVILLAYLFVIINASALDEISSNFALIILSVLFITAILAGLIAVMIFRGNRLFVTNKNVIQRIINSPTSTSINIIHLSSVEDASFHKNGLLQNILHYGTLRLATVGNETTYTFKYSDISSENLKLITRLITEAKKKAKKPSVHHQDSSN